MKSRSINTITLDQEREISEIVDGNLKIVRKANGQESYEVVEIPKLLSDLLVNRKLNSELCLSLIKEMPEALAEITKLADNVDFISTEFYWEAIQVNAESFKYLPDTLQNNADFLYTAVMYEPSIIKYFSEEVSNELGGELYPLAFNKNKELFPFIPEINRNQFMCLNAVEYNKKMLPFVPKALLADGKFYLNLIKRKAIGLADVPPEMHTKEMYSEIVKRNKITKEDLQLFPPEMLTETFYLNLIQEDKILLRDIPPEKRSKKICLLAVQKDSWALESVPANLEGIGEIYLAALKGSAWIILGPSLETGNIEHVVSTLTKIPNKEDASKIFARLITDYSNYHSKINSDEKSMFIKLFKAIIAEGIAIKLPWKIESQVGHEFELYNKLYKNYMVSAKQVFFAPNQSNGLIRPKEAILSRTYYSGEKETLLKDQKLESELETFTNYSKSPLMATMLAVMALAALNKHEGPSNANSPKKPLKIIVYNDTEMHYTTRHVAAIKESGGLFSHKSTIYASKNPESLSPNATIYHEATHMVADEVMHNESRPYPANNSTLKEKFDSVIQETMGALYDMPKHEPQDALVYQKFANLLNSFAYTGAQYPIELIVKIPEVISIFGHEKGIEWLNKYTPSLLKYYEEHFQPACLDYLSRNNAEQYLNLDDGLKEALTNRKVHQAKM